MVGTTYPRFLSGTQSEAARLLLRLENLDVELWFLEPLVMTTIHPGEICVEPLRQALGLRRTLPALADDRNELIVVNLALTLRAQQAQVSLRAKWQAGARIVHPCQPRGPWHRFRRRLP